METLLRMSERPVFLYLLVGTILIVAIGYVIALKADQIVTARRRVHKRIVPLEKLSRQDRETRERNGNSVATLLAEKTNKLYAKSDPKSTKKLKMQMIRAGFFQPNAAGYYLFIRPIVAAVSGYRSIHLRKLFFDRLVVNRSNDGHRRRSIVWILFATFLSQSKN